MPIQEISQFICSSSAMRKIFDLAKQIAPAPASVMITGESGTGKGAIAEMIHLLSDRKDKPFIRANCAIVPESVLEAELFGSDIESRKMPAHKGKFEAADGGTLYLEEIDRLTPSLQMKILDVLNEGTSTVLGKNKVHLVDVRLIVSSNIDLFELVQSGKFRKDLYYRLNIISITVPPLRERIEDIRPLAVCFLKTYSTENKKAMDGFSDEALEVLASYPWPGNLDELANTIEKTVVLSRNRVISISDLPSRITQKKQPKEFITIPIGMPMEEIKDLIIEETLKTTKGDKTLAAKILGITSRTIYRKVGKKHKEE